MNTWHRYGIRAMAAIGAVAVMLTSFWAYAQEHQQQQSNQQTQSDRKEQQAPDKYTVILGPSSPGGYQPRLFAAATLQGMDVRNPNNEKIGSINNLILTPSADQIAFAIVDSDGLRPVPWPALRLSLNDQHLVLFASQDALNKGPAFDKDAWPNFNDTNYVNQVYSHYGLQFAGFAADHTKTREGEKPMIPFSWARRIDELVGTDIKTPNGQDLGEVQNIYLDLSTGVLAYAITNTEDDRKAAIPWNALGLNAQKDHIVINTDQNGLNQYALTENQLWDLANPQFASRFYQAAKQPAFWDIGSATFKAMAEKNKEQSSQWMANSEYNKRFDPNNMVTFVGEINRVTFFQPRPGDWEGVNVVVEAEDGRTYNAHIGPLEFLKGSGVRLEEGDRIQVSGSQVTADGQSFVLAATFMTGDKTVRLRDSRGEPQWQVPTMVVASASPQSQQKQQDQQQQQNQQQQDQQQQQR